MEESAAARVLTWILVAPLMIPVVLGIAASRVRETSTWLVEKNVLVGPDLAVWEVPGLAGAGLDTPRLWGAALAGVVTVSGAVWAITRRRARRRLAEEGE